MDGEEVAQNIQQKRHAFASGLKVDVHTAKIANEGTIEGETSAVLKHCAGEGSGAVLLSGEPLSAFLAGIFKANLDAHVHTIDDRTLRLTLEAVNAARKVAPKSKSRVAVAHALLAAPEDLRRLKTLGVSINHRPAGGNLPPTASKNHLPQLTARRDCSLLWVSIQGEEFSPSAQLPGLCF